MSQYKILIAEDDRGTRKMLSVELQKAGYQVFEAENGANAYQIAEAVRPDLILSDVLMPEMDGNKLRKALHASHFGKNIPFVVLSARGQMQEYFQMVEVTDFIVKPFEIKDLLEKIKKILSNPKPVE